MDRNSWDFINNFGIPGVGIAGEFMAEKFSRKASVILFSVYFIDWLIIDFANNMEVLITDRFLSEHCVRVLVPIYPIYVSETSNPLLWHSARGSQLDPFGRYIGVSRDGNLAALANHRVYLRRVARNLLDRLHLLARESIVAAW